MHQIPLRDLQLRGTKAVPATDEPIVLTGRQGPLYLLVRIDPEHLAEQERAVRRALARANLQAWQSRAVAEGLDTLSDEEVDAEIRAMRQGRRQRRTRDG